MNIPNPHSGSWVKVSILTPPSCPALPVVPRLHEKLKIHWLGTLVDFRALFLSLPCLSCLLCLSLV